MSCIIKSLDKRTGITYVYESTSYWDKEKKQPRSKRVLIGKVDPKTGETVPTDGRGNRRKERLRKEQEQPLAPPKQGPVPAIRTERVFYGATYLLDQIGEITGIVADLKTCFPDTYKQILSVAYYLKTDKDTLLVINNHLEGTHLSDAERDNYKRMLRGKMERDTVKAESMFLIGKLGKNNARRAPQADAVHRYIEAHRHYPIIVCGDFNDTPISYTRHTIAQGLTDCFQETGRGLGLSYNQKGFYFRIDHILCSSDLQPYNCQIDDEMDASDHYPVICYLKMREKP